MVCYSVSSAKTQGLQRVGKDLVPVSPLPPPSTMGAAWQPVPWIHQRCQTLCPPCESCHRLLSHAYGLGLSPHPEQTPFAGLISPAASWDMLYDGTCSLRNQAKEKATKKAAVKLKKSMAKKPVCVTKKPKKAGTKTGGLKEGSSSLCGQESQ